MQHATQIIAVLGILCACAPSWASEVDAAHEAATHPSEAHESREAHQEPQMNAVAIKGAMSFTSEKSDSDKNRGNEVLGGFIISYERVLIDRLLTVELALPFLFGAHGMEGPLDLSIKLFQIYGNWEPFVGLGGAISSRSPWLARDESELFLGVTAIVGFVYVFTHDYGLEFAVDFNYFPADHRLYEITPNAGFIVSF